eukprot:353627-Chlamydomonas_euryale.AAC.3
MGMSPSTHIVASSVDSAASSGSLPLLECKSMPSFSFTGPRHGAASAREMCVARAYNSCPSSINNIQARLLPRQAMVAESVAVLLGHPYIDFSHPLGRCFAMPPARTQTAWPARLAQSRHASCFGRRIRSQTSRVGQRLSNRAVARCYNSYFGGVESWGAIQIAARVPKNCLADGTCPVYGTALILRLGADKVLKLLLRVKV